ncbi:MAG: acyl-CoA/acyl-ACP dehydrogenase [Actinomycetota bacterium]|nr:acyl-CoA/acyl-ACP dehydrogenase [Actinomycetota bacterium]
MSDPNLLYTDVEDDLRASVRALLSARADGFLARVESDSPHDLDLWRELAAIGANSLHVPESAGGQGASWRETAVVAEELGRSVAPVPFLGSTVLATAALMACGETDTLTRLASGAATGVLAVPLSTWPGAALPPITVSDGKLTGTVRSVVDASVADLFVVPTSFGLYVVEDAQVAPVVSLDMTRPIADVTFAGASGVRIADSAQSVVDTALLTGAGILASEQVGLAQWCLELTVDYLKQRYQFGRQVGSFQSLKHRMADLLQEIVVARAAARYAADTLATGDADAPIAVAVAQSLASAVAVHTAEEAVQLHGGVGMTWEHPLHLFLKRAKANEIALGTPGRWRMALAPLIDLPA